MDEWWVEASSSSLLIVVDEGGQGEVVNRVIENVMAVDVDEKWMTSRRSSLLVSSV